MHYLEIELDGIDKNGKKNKYKLSDFKEKNTIVYFYPQDDTPVCTVEAENFRDSIEKLEKYATIIGVSENNIDEHLKFKNKHNLNFILLSDKDNKLKQAFKDHNPNLFDIKRSTFILDKNGNIIKVWDKVDVNDHIDEILKFLQEN